MAHPADFDSAVPLPIGGADGFRPDLRRPIEGIASDGRPLSDAAARAYLADCCDFLRQLARITSAVVETIGVGRVREIVAAELPVCGGVIDDDGKVLTAEKPARADHRTEPRGRRHPVITLLQMALQGVRLLLRILEKTNPTALNELTLEQKQERETLRQTERDFARYMSGKL